MGALGDDPMPSFYLWEVPMFVENLKYVNKNLIGSCGVISFNDEGVAEVNDEYGKMLIQVRGFKEVVRPTSEDKKSVENQFNTDNTSKVLEDKDTAKKGQDFSALSIFQLKKIAKENKVDLGNATKKQEILAILESSL